MRFGVDTKDFTWKRTLKLYSEIEEVVSRLQFTENKKWVDKIWENVEALIYQHRYDNAAKERALQMANEKKKG